MLTIRPRAPLGPAAPSYPVDSAARRSTGRPPRVRRHRQGISVPPLAGQDSRQRRSIHFRPRTDRRSARRRRCAGHHGARGGAVPDPEACLVWTSDANRAGRRRPGARAGPGGAPSGRLGPSGAAATRWLGPGKTAAGLGIDLSIMDSSTMDRRPVRRFHDRSPAADGPAAVHAEAATVLSGLCGSARRPGSAPDGGAVPARPPAVAGRRCPPGRPTPRAPAAWSRIWLTPR
jgi:hypothetical protein